MFKKYKSILLIAFSFIVLIVLVKWISNMESFDRTANPYELNLDTFKNITNVPVGYKELNPVSVPLALATGIAIDKTDKMYVCGDSSVLVYSAEKKLVSRFNIGENPWCIAVGNDKKLYIGFKNYVKIFSPDGLPVTEFPVLSDSCAITSIVVRNSDVFVAEAEFGQIYHYKINGKLIKKIGSKDTTEDIKHFVIPSYYFDVAIDNDSLLWVVNPGKHLLVNLNEDGGVRTFWGKTAADWSGFCGCCNPVHFAILPDNSFITAEKGISRVKKYNAAGELQCVVATPAQFKTEATDFDIAIDSKQKIYILEPEAQIIHIFEPVN